MMSTSRMILTYLEGCTVPRCRMSAPKLSSVNLAPRCCSVVTMCSRSSGSTDASGQATSVEPEDLEHMVTTLQQRGARFTEDNFGALIRHLGTVHPSKYVKIIRDVDIIALTDVYLLTDQTDALRLVAFIDRVYDAEIPIVASGLPLNEVFDPEMLAGGYRKKYQRSQSRMLALTTGELPPHAE